MREVVVNLVIHRDCKNAPPSCLFIFDDRIEMWNAGEMPKGLSLVKLQSGDYEPSAGNPLLTRVFKELGLIENIGSGLQKVTDTCAGFIALAKCDAAIGQTVNIGSGREITMGDLAKLIIAASRKKALLAPDSERKRPSKSEVERLLCDNTLIHNYNV